MGAVASSLIQATEGHGRVALDTAPIVYFLGGYSPRDEVLAQLLELASARRIELVASVLTESELLVGALAAGRDREAAAIGELFDGPVLRAAPVSRAVARTAADLRARLRLKLIDAVVAATALEEGCTALVGNDQDFRKLGATLTYVHVDDVT